MNTDHIHVDYTEAQRAIDAFGQAETLLQLVSGLDILATAIRLPRYLMLEMVGSEPQLSNALHNLPDYELAAIVQSDLTARLIARPIPVVMCHDLNVAALRFGVAVSAPRGHTTCMLYMGRPEGELPRDSAVDLLGITSVCVTHLLDAIVRMRKGVCPLSPRELECLCFANLGLSAKETARRLGISHRTVEEYLANCRSRLNVESTLSAALHALRKGWISFADIEAAGDSISRQSREYRG